MKIIVTGANGFIGRHLLPLLIDEGHEVIAVVRSKKNLINCGGRCQFVELDIADINSHKFMMLKQADTLIHLAWGYLSNYRTLQHIETELPVHYQFIKKIISLGVMNISVVGTCFEYGMQSGELSESLATQPDNPYGFAKDTLRKQLGFFRIKYDFNLTWMRLFYMYGDDQPANTLYSQLRAAVNKGEQVFNMSGGEQLRDYLHINEVAKGILTMGSRQDNIGLVNICSGQPISVRRLVEQWKESNNWNIKFNYGYYSYPDYEPLAFWGNNAKYQSLASVKNSI